jgi:hypothetical protein
MLQRFPTSSSDNLSDLHKVFLTGLTLLVAHPHILSLKDLMTAIGACASSLFFFAQYIKAAEPFRDAFRESE